MEHKKDIGDLFKNRLENAQKAPKGHLWERLDNSLEERDKKRRRAAWFWYTGAGILLALLILGGVMISQYSKGNDSTPVKISTTKNTDKKRTTTETEINTKTQVTTKSTNKAIPQSGSKKNTKDLEKAKDTNQRTSIPQVLVTTPLQKKKDTTTQNTITEKSTQQANHSNTQNTMTKSGYTVTTTHQYYNSDLDTTTTSQHKQQIDSIVTANKRHMALKDSISRKRAQDSIKVNKTKKDTVPE
ncbi:MAG: hypothetical protein CMC70_01250 [Flavobacteriaceae bacterium]|nr:hypothetical protein [Flavobacteriaceae bacterium]|tara:strand:- start:4 stop:732 length:729 start_codon:yes stop_codon:yes gene_type:complete